jgi:hypothetical protein
MTWGDPTRTNWNIPKDARVIQDNGNWQIYYSESSAHLYFYPTDYHPNALALSLSDLRRLLQRLESSYEQHPREDDTAPLTGSNWGQANTVSVDASRRWMETR